MFFWLAEVNLTLSSRTNELPANVTSFYSPNITPCRNQFASYSDYIGRRQWHPTPVLLPGKSHGWRSLVGCSPWGNYESDMTKWLHFYFSLSCIGEGNGNPLQCSCLENPRDGGAWWAAVYGVAQSQTRLKRLSGSSPTTPSVQSALASESSVSWFTHCASVLILSSHKNAKEWGV